MELEAAKAAEAELLEDLDAEQLKEARWRVVAGAWGGWGIAPGVFCGFWSYLLFSVRLVFVCLGVGGWGRGVRGGPSCFFGIPSKKERVAILV